MEWIVLIILAGTAFYEYPRLRRAGQFKELWLFTFLLAFGMLLSVAEYLHMPIPNPLDWITALYKPMSRTILSTLE
ncbi:hypothetical protein GZH47_25155 [Paenibacillus rhizovicinus]|uniref:Uncharacterized protein n=1 Tax=Paenibacillus rhizovicinus TaxID=2704463 RepID=A0A6C0P5Y3_9BACL|nr:hypothetical protein [Paenibacillus rhizovicinus]QHW33761.1 hypothetical protein GZH47_25155 [Paenibacillus rhizovicinus]